jgi:hypothetical protein
VGASGEIIPQLTAFFTRAPILSSSAAVNSFSAKAVGHMAPSSRFAASVKPNVAYLVLNFCALWKKQTTLLSLTSDLFSPSPKHEGSFCCLMAQASAASCTESAACLG